MKDILELMRKHDENCATLKGTESIINFDEYSL